MQGIKDNRGRKAEIRRIDIVTIKGTYRCDTTQHPNTLNSWDIRSVSVDLPEEEDKPYWIRVGAMVIGFVLVLLVWYLVFGY